MKYLFVLCFLFQVISMSANAQSYKYHTVKKGETVFSISQSYSIDEEDIYKYNPEAKNGIGIDEKLVIPISENKTEVSSNTETSATPVSFKEHQVKKKETLYSLSKEYGVSIDHIKRYNKQLYSKELQIGETIQIPVGSIPAENVVVNNSPASSNQSEKPVVERPVNTNRSGNPQNFKTREHIVLPQETKYGIARKYGMTLKELDEMNPKIEILQPGMMIRVGTAVLDEEPVIITDDRFRFYEVKPQETLYRLSKKFQVSQDSLIRLNPALTEGLKFGMVLKVPKKDGNFEEEDASYTGMGSESQSKVDLKSFINNRDTKEIALMLPFHLDKVDADSIPTYRNAILNERVIRISLDFHSGVLMAVEKAKSLGISTNLKVYDTRRSTGEVSNILRTNNFDNVDAVIGPLIQDVTETVAGALENKNIPVINPLSNRSMKGYGNLFQSRPSEEFLRSKMVDYIARNASGKNVIVVADSKSNAIKNELMSAVPSARTVNPSDNFVSEAKLAEVMSSGENWVILESENMNLISSVAAALNRLTRNNRITLLTTNKNNGYESDVISNNHLGKLRLHYPSVDKEFDTQQVDEFVKEYSKKFKVQPNQYAVRGYDLTMDVLLRLASAEDLYESFEKYPGYTEYYESKFHYLMKPEGGYTNDAIYILNLNEDLTITEANDL
ncbi:LysM peptidoglycan-binding domain-containing protein [Christiangramia portivictoriae]|uniref:LysM peptidoglycan-binding domain-containing protein n=1 Tax=Christiangramia portivictoriae TaxID=326069 RepID=UPI000411E437|nr:LysM peptidoglycan-binding domain-containing protein [Christiangramia portivictoriae]